MTAILTWSERLEILRKAEVYDREASRSGRPELAGFAEALRCLAAVPAPGRAASPPGASGERCVTGGGR